MQKNDYIHEKIPAYHRGPGAHSETTDESFMTDNARMIREEIGWLDKLLTARLSELNDPEANSLSFRDFGPSAFSMAPSSYQNFLQELSLNDTERLLLIAALVPHIAPEIFTEKTQNEEAPLKIKYHELGGYFDVTFTNFVPTLQTVVFLLGGADMSLQLYSHLFLLERSILVREQIITFRPVSTSEDDTNMRNYAVNLAPEYVDYLISGRKPRPDFGRAFPATLITTGLSWDQLVVKPAVRTELERIVRWEKHGTDLIEKTNGRLNASFTCLFHGPSGSGKTLAVQLLGKSLGIDVFRIDLSMVVSKYIGETEKNLAYLFDRAKGKKWILFFDEADALFGKRTDIGDAKDKWANLEMSYLLQRMEEHVGLTILATNLKNNIDTAMTRRFQSVIFFNRPEKEQRAELWRKLLPEPFSYHPELSFEKLARYELTGGNITNVIKAACLEATARDSEQIDSQELADAIMREFYKENRVPN